MIYLGRPIDAWQILRDQGIGITNLNPISLDNLSGDDADADGLPNSLEIAINTNPLNPDTDQDGFDDRTELLNGYNPNGSEKIIFDNAFANSHKGKIFLQVESHGEAWYVNPANGKRYFLGRPADAFRIMSSLGLGISNTDFNNLQKILETFKFLNWYPFRVNVLIKQKTFKQIKFCYN